jgi:hypothetical protein
MEHGMFWSWLALLLLGAWHGINPGMGWLFAVALGLQEQKGSAVRRALWPLALGHGLAIGAAVLLAMLAGLVLPLGSLKWVVAAILGGLGLYRLFRSSHPRYGGMLVNSKELTVWSFLMASAHGAGLMVLPIVLGMTAGPLAMGSSAVPLHGPTHAGTAVVSVGQMGHGAHSMMLLSVLPDGQFAGLAATLVHTVGYLVFMGLIAVLVYEKLGLRLLRTLWFNLDLVWAGTLILTGVLTPLI